MLIASIQTKLLWGLKVVKFKKRKGELEYGKV